jgi:hypothetical protein
MRAKIKIMFAVLAVLLLGVSPALADGQSEVRGHAKVQLGDPSVVSVSEINVNVWVDKNGDAQGMLNWVGGVGPEAVPPALPWHMQVTSIDFSGNTATVCWVVVHSVFPEEIGISDCFDFTDNGATGQPDEIVGVPIEAGNIIVR